MNRLISPPNLDQQAKGYRAEVAEVALMWSVVWVFIGAIWGISRVHQAGGPDYRIPVLVVLTIAGGSYLLRRRLSPNLKGGIASGLFLFIGTMTLLRAGPTSYAPINLAFAATLAGLCFGMRIWAWTCAGITLLVAAIGLAVSAQWVEVNYHLPGFMNTPTEWLQVIWMVVLMSLLLLQVVRTLLQHLMRNAAALTRSNEELLSEAARRQEAIAALAVSEHRYRMLIENSNELVLLTTGDNHVLYASPNHAAITGRKPEDLLGRNLLDNIHPTDLGKIAAKLAQPRATAVFRYRFQDGSWHWFESSRRAFRLEDGAERCVIISRDISERIQAEEKHRQLEGQLRQSQKLEAIGTLAGGIAHDFNNILTGIVGNIQLAEMDLPDPHPSSPWLRDALKASKRARELVAQILTFSRRGDQEMAPARVGPVVKEALRLLRASLPATLEIRTEIDDDCAPILCDVTQIHQVVMNLGTNAAHAMRGTPGNRLTVTLGRVAHPAEFLARHPQVRPELTICLGVRDQGTGMNAATLERIFEPFFTTKTPGEGTGLGLSVVHGIMQDHGGAIVVESTPGEGTVFHLYFAAVEAGAGTMDPFTEVPPRLGRGQRILLIDDDPLVANVATSMISRLGYQLEPFLRAEEALAAFRRSPGNYHAVLTDLTMSGFSGVELARQILADRRDIPVIMATGHLHSDAIEQARAVGVSHFIKKPFVLHDLANLLHTALGG